MLFWLNLGDSTVLWFRGSHMNVPSKHHTRTKKALENCYSNMKIPVLLRCRLFFLYKFFNFHSLLWSRITIYREITTKNGIFFPKERNGATQKWMWMKDKHWTLPAFVNVNFVGQLMDTGRKTRSDKLQYCTLVLKYLLLWGAQNSCFKQSLVQRCVLMFSDDIVQSSLLVMISVSRQIVDDVLK